MALIGGLAAICLAFIFLIISPGRTPFTQSAPQAAAAPAAPPPSAVEAPEADIVPVAPDTVAAAPEPATQPPPPAEPTPQALPEGGFALERIGFSFVTGGVGACNIVLEPWRHVAVSRDILAEYPCGSEITITLDETVAGRQQLRAIVADTMSPAFSRTVNIYVGQDEPAQEYGVRTGRFAP